MKTIASRIPLLVTGFVLLAAMFVMVTGRLEYCGEPKAPRPTCDSAMATDTTAPTPAPPQKVVFIQVESDKPGLEIGWAD